MCAFSSSLNLWLTSISEPGFPLSPRMNGLDKNQEPQEDTAARGDLGEIFSNSSGFGNKVGVHKSVGFSGLPEQA